MTDMNKKYSAIFKCRLCGEEFEAEIGEPIKDSSVAFAYVSVLDSQEHFCGCGRNGRRYRAHKCIGGSFGFSDFLGLKKIENEV